MKIADLVEQLQRLRSPDTIVKVWDRTAAEYRPVTGFLWDEHELLLHTLPPDDEQT